MNLTKSTDFTPNLGRLTSALPPLFLRSSSVVSPLMLKRVNGERMEVVFVQYLTVAILYRRKRHGVTRHSRFWSYIHRFHVKNLAEWEIMLIFAAIKLEKRQKYAKIGWKSGRILLEIG